jgi:hypothetical protein
MSTITEESSVPQATLQAKIDERLFDQLKVLAARKKCYPRDIINDTLKRELPKIQRALDRRGRA